MIKWERIEEEDKIDITRTQIIFIDKCTGHSMRRKDMVRSMEGVEIPVKGRKPNL